MKQKKPSKQNAYIELLRPVNCIMAAFGVFIGYSIAFGTIAVSWQLLAAMIVAFIICGAGQAINDFFDARIDESLHPEKPIPRRAISKEAVLAYSIILFIIGNALALLLPLQSLLISVAFTILLVIYSAKMNRIKYIGNWVVALGTAFTLVFGASLIGNYGIVLVLAVSALFANAAREIIKDTEDIDSDWGKKLSLPMIIKKPAAKIIVLLLHIFAILVPLLAFFLLNFGNWIFFLLVLVSGAVFIYSSALFFKNNPGKAQKFSKIGMIIALVGFLLGGV